MSLHQDIICSTPLSEEDLSQACARFFRDIRPHRERLMDYYLGRQSVPKGEAVRGRPDNRLRVPFPRYITQVQTGYFLGQPPTLAFDRSQEGAVFAALPDAPHFPCLLYEAALDAAPKDLGGKGLTILLAPGEYDEDVSIKGFFHRSEYSYLEIRGATNPGSGYPEATHRVKSISVGQNACHVSLTGLWIYGANASGRAVSLSTPGVSMDYCTVKNEGGAVQGVIVGYYGHALATLKNIAVDGYTQQGIAVDGASVVALHGANVTNNGVGISTAVSGGGGIVTVYNVTYSGNTTDTKQSYGGQILGGE